MKIAGISNAKYAQAFKGEIQTNEKAILKLIDDKEIDKDKFDKMKDFAKTKPSDIHIDFRDNQFIVFTVTNGRGPVIESGARFWDVWNAFTKNFSPKK